MGQRASSVGLAGQSRPALGVDLIHQCRRILRSSPSEVNILRTGSALPPSDRIVRTLLPLDGAASGLGRARSGCAPGFRVGASAQSERNR